MGEIVKEVVDFLNFFNLFSEWAKKNSQYTYFIEPLLYIASTLLVVFLLIFLFDQRKFKENYKRIDQLEKMYDENRNYKPSNTNEFIFMELIKQDLDKRREDMKNWSNQIIFFLFFFLSLIFGGLMQFQQMPKLLYIIPYLISATALLLIDKKLLAYNFIERIRQIINYIYSFKRFKIVKYIIVFIGVILSSSILSIFTFFLSPFILSDLRVNFNDGIMIGFFFSCLLFITYPFIYYFHSKIKYSFKFLAKSIKNIFIFKH